MGQRKMKFTLLQKNEILIKGNKGCACCGKELTLETMTVDHYIPVSKGGKSTMDNLYPLCERCNQLKDNTIYFGDECYPLIYYRYNESLDSKYFEYRKKLVDKLRKKLKHLYIITDTYKFLIGGLKDNKLQINLHKDIIDLSFKCNAAIYLKNGYSTKELKTIPELKINLSDIEFNRLMKINNCFVFLSTSDKIYKFGQLEKVNTRGLLDLTS